MGEEGLLAGQYCGRNTKGSLDSSAVKGIETFFNFRDTQRENFTIGVGTPFLRYKCPLVRFKGLFLNAKKNVSVRIRQLNFQTLEKSKEKNIITRIYELPLPFRKR